MLSNHRDRILLQKYDTQISTPAQQINPKMAYLQAGSQKWGTFLSSGCFRGPSGVSPKDPVGCRSDHMDKAPAFHSVPGKHVGATPTRGTPWNP